MCSLTYSDGIRQDRDLNRYETVGLTPFDRVRLACSNPLIGFSSLADCSRQKTPGQGFEPRPDDRLASLSAATGLIQIPSFAFHRNRDSLRSSVDFGKNARTGI